MIAPHDTHQPPRPDEVDDTRQGITCVACGDWYETWSDCTCEACRGLRCIFCGKPSEVRKVKPFKTCSCGLSYTAETWKALRLVGYYDDDVLDAEHPKATTLELRNCVCRSTLSVELPRRKPYHAPRVVELSREDPRVQRMMRDGPARK